MKRYLDDKGEIRLVPVVRDVLIVMFAIALLFTYWPVRTVPTGSRGVITVGGAIKGIEAEGFTLIAPWQRLDVFSIRAEQADINKAEGATKDTQPVNTSLTVRYSIFPDKVSEVFEKYSHDGNLNSYIQTATMETFKAVTARYTAPDLIAQRALVSSDIRTLLATKVALYGAQIINIDMTGFAFSETYMKAINEKVTQEQLRLGAENKLLTVQSEQKQKVAVAEAEATALRAQADGEAYATVKAANAAAEALRVKNAAIKDSPAILELRRIDVEMEKAGRWNGELPQNIYGSAPIPFMTVGGK